MQPRRRDKPAVPHRRQPPRPLVVARHRHQRNRPPRHHQLPRRGAVVHVQLQLQPRRRRVHPARARALLRGHIPEQRPTQAPAAPSASPRRASPSPTAPPRASAPPPAHRPARSPRRRGPPAPREGPPRAPPAARSGRAARRPTPASARRSARTPPAPSPRARGHPPPPLLGRRRHPQRAKLHHAHRPARPRVGIGQLLDVELRAVRVARAVDQQRREGVPEALGGSRIHRVRRRFRAGRATGTARQSAPGPPSGRGPWGWPWTHCGANRYDSDGWWFT